MNDLQFVIDQLKALSFSMSDPVDQYTLNLRIAELEVIQKQLKGVE